MSVTTNHNWSLLEENQYNKHITINTVISEIDDLIGDLATGGAYNGTLKPYLIDQAGLNTHQDTWTTDGWKRGYRLASSSILQFGEVSVSGKAYGIGNYAGILSLFSATDESNTATATTILAVEGTTLLKYYGSRTLLGGLADDTVSALQVNGTIAAGPKTAGRFELVPGAVSILQAYDRTAGAYVTGQIHFSSFQLKPAGGQTMMWIDNTGSYFYTAAGAMSLSLGGAAIVSYLPLVTTSYAIFPEVYIDSPSGSFGSLHLRGASNLQRWDIAKNNTAESGSNVGADFVIYRYNDAGSTLGTPFYIERATGNITLENKLTVGASTTAGASLNVPSGTAPTSPNNGDVWFDGTDFKVRIGGVTKTVTVV